jgi:hypothetical protein
MPIFILYALLQIDSRFVELSHRVLKAESGSSDLVNENRHLKAELDKVSTDYQKVKNIEEQLIDTVNTHTALLDEVNKLINK